MRGPVTIGALLIALSTTAVGAQDKDIEYGTLMVRHVDGLVTWSDRGDEASYRISGNVSYWPEPSCAPDRLLIPGERVEFDEELPSGTTSYQLPNPGDGRLTFRKDATFFIEALAGDGSVIAQDGSGFTADPFCTPEEIAAAGTGPGSMGRDTPALASAALAAFGAIAIGGALLSRRRRA